MENSRIQLWQCRIPLVPYLKIKEEPEESLDCIEPIDDGYCLKDKQKLQVQDNERNMNEILIPETHIMNGIVIPKNQIPQGTYTENILNETVSLDIQKPNGQYNENILNEIAIPEIPNPLLNETSISENPIALGQYNENVSNEIATLAIQIPQGKYNRNIRDEIAIPENQILQSKYKKVIMNEFFNPENQILQDQYNNNNNIVNEMAIPENKVIKKKTMFPNNQMPQGQYNKNIMKKVFIPENKVNLSNIGNDNDGVKCRIKGCICTNPYENQNINLRSTRKKHLPRLTRIRRPFMNSPSPRRRHLPRLTRIKLPPLKRTKPLPLELGNTRIISNIPQPNATPLIISTQEIIHRIIQKSYEKLSMNSNVNSISGNQNISREDNKDLSKRIFKKSVSMIKRMNPNLPRNILHMKENIRNEIFGTVFEYYKNNLGNNRFQGEYRCIECGYRSKYSHHIKPHVKSHNLEKNKENRKQIPSCNMNENNQTHSLDKSDKMENKISSSSVLPKMPKRIRKKNQWQKCPLCLYISNSTIALTNHINLSHKDHQKQKSYALYIKGDKMIEETLSKNHCLGNDRIENKILTNKSRSKAIEVCSICGFDTYSLPELNSHLQSHIPCEFQRNNSVDNFLCDNQTFSSTKQNSENERKIINGENSNYIKDNIANSPTIKNGIKRNHKRLKISDFFPILDLNISSNVQGNINYQDNNGNCIYTEYNNKQISEKEKEDPSDIKISNQYAENFIRFDNNKYSENTIDAEEDRYSGVSDTEIVSESMELVQPINEVFRYPNGYLLKESPRKSFESKINVKDNSHFNGMNNVKEDLSCLECSAFFKNPWDYNRHIKRSHKKCNECSPEQECAYRISKEYPVLMKTKSFECSECNYASITKGSFVRHMQTHAIEKKFECNICGYLCNGSGELQRHIWVHKGGGKHLNFWPLTNFL